MLFKNADVWESLDAVVSLACAHQVSVTWAAAWLFFLVIAWEKEVVIALLQPFPFRALLTSFSSRCLLGVEGGIGAPAPLPGPPLPS